ncbi:hypothetical protein M0R45_006574 [Rubus argutus]|uniref:Uncharacterized protein n=1 Tax=Rubus argutus TaxID=59490 RepID=A0AAW1YR58_RUBAR
MGLMAGSTAVRPGICDAGCEKWRRRREWARHRHLGGRTRWKLRSRAGHHVNGGGDSLRNNGLHGFWWLGRAAMHGLSNEMVDGLLEMSVEFGGFVVTTVVMVYGHG